MRNHSCKEKRQNLLRATSTATSSARTSEAHIRPEAKKHCSSTGLLWATAGNATCATDTSAPKDYINGISAPLQGVTRKATSTSTSLPRQTISFSFATTDANHLSRASHLRSIFLRCIGTVSTFGAYPRDCCIETASLVELTRRKAI